MFAWTALTLTLLIAAIALRMLWRGTAMKGSAGIARIVYGGALTMFIALFGAWVYLSVYGRPAIAIAGLAVFITGLVKHRNRGAKLAKSRAGGYFALATGLLVLDVLYFTGTAGSPPVVHLQFPLRGKKYVVFQGGKGLPANLFHFSSRRAAYAMDIAKLDRWGRRADAVFSSKLGDYYIYGDTVFAPCAGTVQRAISDNPDNIPPTRKRGPHNLNGVVLEGGDCTIFLGHMRQGGVFVNAGQKVAAGEPLGLVGNSGMSIEPHLHIQAHKRAPAGELWWSQPQLFMLFEGRQYLLFDVISPTRSTR